MVNRTSVKFGSGASVAMPTEKTNTDNNPDPLTAPYQPERIHIREWHFDHPPSLYTPRWTRW
jgi:hypothetical protein